MHYELLAARYGSREAQALYELVMRRRFGLSRTDILLGKDTTLSADNKAELQIIVDRVAKGEPVQYVLGCEVFCGHTFRVAPGSSILDIGTGSGCIAITLALSSYQMTATDVSEQALCIARKNAERLHAEVRFEQENILQPKPCKRIWDAIVSNPPYICQSEASEMDENVLLYEPHVALFVPDDNPLLFYRAIAEYGLQHLTEDGKLFFETNRAFAKQVEKLLMQKGYEDVCIMNDQFDNERFVCARKK